MTEIKLGESDQTPKGEFDICTLEDGRYLIKYHGDIKELVDAWIADGITRHIIKNGDDVYLVMNPEDIPDELK